MLLWPRDTSFLRGEYLIGTVHIPFEHLQVIYLRQLKMESQIYTKKKKGWSFLQS